MPRNAVTGADTDQASAAALTRASRPRQTKGYSSLNDGASLSAALTAFGCASDPLGVPTYQSPAEAGATAVTTGPVGGIGANAQTVKPNATSGAGGAGGGVSSSAGCVGAGDFASAAIGGC